MSLSKDLITKGYVAMEPALMQDERLPASSKILMCVFAIEHLRGLPIRYSIERLQNILGVKSRKTVTKAIAHLQKRGLVQHRKGTSDYGCSMKRGNFYVPVLVLLHPGLSPETKLFLAQCLLHRPCGGAAAIGATVHLKSGISNKAFANLKKWGVLYRDDQRAVLHTNAMTWQIPTPEVPPGTAERIRDNRMKYPQYLAQFPHKSPKPKRVITNNAGEIISTSPTEGGIPASEWFK